MKTLALQGGGCLGKGQATALRILEQRLIERTGNPQARLSRVYDLGGGTSVGAINMAAVAAGVSMRILNGFFDEQAPKIFRPSWRPWLVERLFHAAKYDPAPLEAALKAMLGDRSLGDCEMHMVATAVDMASGRNVYFQSYGTTHETADEIVIAPDSGIKLWEVCRASAAAQSYFPAYVWNGLVLWDGGSTGANAPDMLVLTEALAPGDVPMEKIEMLSMGAGRTRWTRQGRKMVNPGLLDIVGATMDIAYACGEVNEVWQASQLLGARHERINPDLRRAYAIDDPSPTTLTALARAWTVAMENH